MKFFSAISDIITSSFHHMLQYLRGNQENYHPHNRHNHRHHYFHLLSFSSSLYHHYFKIATSFTAIKLIAASFQILIHSSKLFYVFNCSFFRSYFDKFYFCAYAKQASVCKPEGDGISSKQNLLGSPLLRVSVWLVAMLACFGNLLVLLGRCLLLREDNPIHSFFIKNLRYV